MARYAYQVRLVHSSKGSNTKKCYEMEGKRIGRGNTLASGGPLETNVVEKNGSSGKRGERLEKEVLNWAVRKQKKRKKLLNTPKERPPSLRRIPSRKETPSPSHKRKGSAKKENQNRTSKVDKPNSRSVHPPGGAKSKPTANIGYFGDNSDFLQRVGGRAHKSKKKGEMAACAGKAIRSTGPHSLQKKSGGQNPNSRERSASNRKKKKKKQRSEKGGSSNKQFKENVGRGCTTQEAASERSGKMQKQGAPMQAGKARTRYSPLEEERKAANFNYKALDAV